jgi:hypothetical protein
MSYAFLFGSVGVWIGHITEDHGVTDGSVLEAGARVDVRRIDELPGHRPSAEGFAFPTLNSGGIWRADLLWEVVPATLRACLHDHPYRYGDEVVRAKRQFRSEMGTDPVGWTIGQLGSLDRVLVDAGAGELVAGCDMDEVRRLLPAMRAAIDESIARDRRLDPVLVPIPTAG